MMTHEQQLDQCHRDGWTGQWAATFERTAAGLTHLRAGMEKTHLVLHPGERIRARIEARAAQPAGT